MSRLGSYVLGGLIVAATASCGYPDFTFGGAGGGVGADAGAGGGSSSSGQLTCTDVQGTVGCCNAKLDAVTYCSSGTVTTMACTKGTVCGWNASYIDYDCVAAPGGADPLGLFTEMCP
jgi:hypothetical protein